MKFDDLDAKMRVFETAHDHSVLPGVFIMARLDGRGFTKLTKQERPFEAPLDATFRDYMVSTTEHLMDCGFRVGVVPCVVTFLVKKLSPKVSPQGKKGRKGSRAIPRNPFLSNHFHRSGGEGSRTLDLSIAKTVSRTSPFGLFPWKQRHSSNRNGNCKLSHRMALIPRKWRYLGSRQERKTVDYRFAYMPLRRAVTPTKQT